MDSFNGIGCRGGWGREVVCVNYNRGDVHNWVDKFSQVHSKVADDARLGRSVVITTQASVQRVEVFGVSTHW
jgi:hypothetical protein